MKEEKVGLTAINWILSIVGILLLLAIIILPPVFRTYLKEEKPEEPEKQYVTVGELVCSKNDISGENYLDNDALIINYQNNSIKSYTNRVERIYSDSIVYEQEKITYGKYVSSFVSISGYEYSATPNDDNSAIMIVSKYDMSKFLPVTVAVEGEENPMAVTNHYLLLDTLIDTQNNLSVNGYTCEKQNEHQVEVK